MRIGLDFDNTIVCYDQAIALLAEKLFELPLDLPRTKLVLRDFLRAAGREPEWTAFQGELYGPGMQYAQPFDGAIVTMQELMAAGHELVIISHRSRRPYAGPAHDLHAAARGWVSSHLQSKGLFGVVGDTSSAFFLETLAEKINKIKELNIDYYLDDLPAVLGAPSFPIGTNPILLSANEGKSRYLGPSISQWSELLPYILDQ